MRKLRFSVNSVQKSLLRAFTYMQNAPEELDKDIFLVIVTGTALKLEQFGTTFSRLNPCPFLSSVETDDRNHFQCLKIFLNNKFGINPGWGWKDPAMDYHTLSHSSQVYKFGYQKI